MVYTDVTRLIVISTLIFLIAPAALLVYVLFYNSRKKRHHLEKEQMKLVFESEIGKARHEIREQTLQTVGADLHDNIGQLLSLVSLTLKSIDPDDTGSHSKKLDSAIELTSRSIRELRQLGKLFQADQLLKHGLSEAIAQELQWVGRLGNLAVNYQHEAAGTSNPSKDLLLFRMFQEALNNCIKHAAASQIIVVLDYPTERLRLLIADDGVGLPPAEQRRLKAGMGLNNLHERAAIAGGSVQVANRPGGGTEVVISVPYP